ncbi:DUF4386 domain-containing protein [Marinomonas transparens]|uniref:DUF4386 domain-containing protein n=1 Tax=Marinomonas transparens TaxID=2795388 RepID=A0A934JWD4_9GAMM|nr:DUF4386 domain-containing protein [Marinomonas transparens]MBJ7539601.1 DUF4386 domain-containing protein [Marinomonas transparens]
MTLTDQPNHLARKAAILYLLLIPLGFFGLMYIPEILTDREDARTTYQNISNHLYVFRLSSSSALLIQVIQLFLVLALYDLLKVVNLSVAKMMVFFILLAIPIAMIIELLHTAIFYLIQHKVLDASFTAEQIHKIIMLLLNAHNDGVMVAHIFWGLWLFPMGYLVIKSGFIPRFIGYLLILGCVGYLADTIIWLLMPNSSVEVAQYTFIGEVVLPIWLLIKGVNAKKWSLLVSRTQG